MKKELREAFTAQIEARQELNALPENATEEARAGSIKKLNDADQKVAELLKKEEETAPIELRDRISLGRYLMGIAGQRKLDGAEGELRTELKLSDEAIPLEALLPTPEERADQISPQNTDGDMLPAGTINLSTGTMLTRVFKATDAAFLGISMPTVPAGKRRYPVMTDGTTASMQGRGAGPDAGAAKFEVVDAEPHRLTGRYILDLEGVAEMGGLLESTLRSDLRTEMGYQLDLQMLLGTGADNQVSGLIKELDLIAPPGPAGTFSTNDVAQPTWTTAKQMLTDGLDGKHRRTERDFRILVGNQTYSFLRTLYRADETDEDAVMGMRGLGARLSNSFQIPDPAVATIGPDGKADSSKKVQSAIVNSEPGAAVAPVWQGITMIRDPYTQAKSAQIVLTAHMLFDFVMRRKDGWSRWAIRTEK